MSPVLSLAASRKRAKSAGFFGQFHHRPRRGRARRVVPRGRDDHIIAGKLAVGDLPAVDRRIGDHGRNVRAGVGTAVGGEFAEVIFEIGDHIMEHRNDFLGALDRLAPAIEFRIGRAEELLRQHQHSRLVLGRHPQNVHDHAQRIMRCDVAREVACVAERQHMIDRLARNLADPVFDDSQILGHEPALRQQAVFHVVGRVHLNERADEVPVTPGCRGARERFAVAVGQHRGADAVREALRVAADCHDVGMARDEPERVVGGIFRDRQGRVRARPGQSFVKRLPRGIGGGVDDRGGNLSGQYRFCHETKLPQD